MKKLRKLRMKLIYAWRAVWHPIVFTFQVARTPWRDIPKKYKWLKLVTYVLIVIFAIYAFALILGLYMAFVFAFGVTDGAAETFEKAMRNQTSTRSRRGPFV